MPNVFAKTTQRLDGKLDLGFFLQLETILNFWLKLEKGKRGQNQKPLKLRDNYGKPTSIYLVSPQSHS